jgi:hypothetical protein
LREDVLEKELVSVGPLGEPSHNVALENGNSSIEEQERSAPWMELEIQRAKGLQEEEVEHQPGGWGHRSDLRKKMRAEDAGLEDQGRHRAGRRRATYASVDWRDGDEGRAQGRDNREMSGRAPRGEVERSKEEEERERNAREGDGGERDAARACWEQPSVGGEMKTVRRARL